MVVKELTFNNFVTGFPPFLAGEDDFTCGYNVLPNGQVDLTCLTTGQTNEEIDLQCVLMPSLLNEILNGIGLGIIHHKKGGDLDCVGTVTLAIDDGAGGIESFWVTNIIGDAQNRN